MNKSRSILIALLLIPCLSFASGGQQTSALDELIDQYESKQRVASAASPLNLESENRKLKNQIIDLRVEQDALNEMINYLDTIIKNHEASEQGLQSACHDSECVPLKEVMTEKLITYVIYSLGMYRLAELLGQVAPETNIEAHAKAQKIMNGVVKDLDALGFDTSDMAETPNLDELLEQLEIAQGSAIAQ